ncbi:MAG TPA: hypothetical protein PKL54_15950, partial [Candidatus Hydrogenedentes bacterium]|nr:hypothetical protein [Candidatus Hydrogenedentota bacterium]
MYIGSQTNSTLVDVFRIGLQEVIKATGLPEEVRFNTENCTLFIRGTDLANRIDQLRILFKPKPGVTQEELEKGVAA